MGERSTSAVEWECVGCAAHNTGEQCDACGHTQECSDYTFCHHAATGGDAECICGATVPRTLRRNSTGGVVAPRCVTRTPGGPK